MEAATVDDKNIGKLSSVNTQYNNGHNIQKAVRSVGVKTPNDYHAIPRLYYLSSFYRHSPVLCRFHKLSYVLVSPHSITLTTRLTNYFTKLD